MKVYQKLASMVQASLNCEESGNNKWFEIWSVRIADQVRNGPSGSGCDNGTEIDLFRSSASRLAFRGSFHHMDENGGYDGWTDHTIRVKPSLANGFDLSISGPNRHNIKEYLDDMFRSWLSEEADES